MKAAPVVEGLGIQAGSLPLLLQSEGLPARVAGCRAGRRAAAQQLLKAPPSVGQVLTARVML